MNKDEWVYISRKITHREMCGLGESAVYFRGVRIPPLKVKKDTARHDLPKYKNGNLTLPKAMKEIILTHEVPTPTNPGNIIVCALRPNERLFKPLTATANTSKKRQPEDSSHESIRSKGQKMITGNTIASGRTTQSVSPKTDQQLNYFWRNMFYAEDKVNIDDLPYFQFRNIMNSEGTSIISVFLGHMLMIFEDVKKGFEQMLTLDNGLGQNVIGHFWPQSTPKLVDYCLLDAPFSSTIDSYMDNDLGSEFSYDIPRPKPFGINLLYHNDSDVLACQQEATATLPSILANMPHKDNGEVEALSTLLLGPPTIEAARRCEYFPF